MAAANRALRADSPQGGEVTVHLEGSWSGTPAVVGNGVSLVADVYQHEGMAHAVVDDRAGLLVLHPDLLLSGVLRGPMMRCQSSHLVPNCQCPHYVTCFGFRTLVLCASVALICRLQEAQLRGYPHC